MKPIGAVWTKTDRAGQFINFCEEAKVAVGDGNAEWLVLKSDAYKLAGSYQKNAEAHYVSLEKERKEMEQKEREFRRDREKNQMKLERFKMQCELEDKLLGRNKDNESMGIDSMDKLAMISVCVGLIVGCISFLAVRIL